MAAFFNYPYHNNRWEDGDIAITRPFVCGISKEMYGMCVALKYMGGGLINNILLSQNQVIICFTFYLFAVSRDRR